MATINTINNEINIKIVYYGPGLSGKTTNLRYIYQNVPQNLVSEMISLDTPEERTLFFDFLPMELGFVHGFKIRLLLYTVPGQTYYESSRELVLRNCDGIIFVVDSQLEQFEANIESLASMRRNLLAQGMNITQIPWIIQYNKRDLKNILDIPVLERKINHFGVESFEAVAKTGKGVFPTIKNISKLVIRKLE